VRPAATARSAKAAVTRSVSLPSWITRAPPVAMRLPAPTVSVATSTGPGSVGRRKKADTASGSGAGMTRASARRATPST
jgi:hypothetical protein